MVIKDAYQQMMFEAAELEYNHHHCPISLNMKDMEYAKKFVKENKISINKLIGIHLGSSSRWPSKAWHPENLKEFIIKARKKGFEIAGPYIEIYSHWTDDEAKQETELIMGLR